ncbi:uncharacterized protein LOC144123966 [Amblyomma americanum]
MQITDNDDTDYQLILPQLPTGSIVLNTVYLHGDVRARPYRAEDFREALVPTGLLPDVVALGAYQVNHVWAVTLNGAEATRRLLAFKELKVKNSRCVIIDPQDHQVRLTLHWLLHGVADEDVRSALAAFGTVMDVSRERWRVQGMSDKGSMTRTVGLKLKKGMTVEDLPHQIRVGGELALAVAPGRPMQCLRCHGTGHVRRECKVPRCSNCRRFGHEDSQCVRTYASAMGPGERDEAEHLMDATEAEDAAKGTGDPLPTAVAEQAALAANQDVRMKVHWLLHSVSDDDVKLAFAAFGKVTDVARERWRVQGMADKGSTTRLVTLKLKPGVKLDDIPHQLNADVASVPDAFEDEGARSTGVRKYPAVRPRDTKYTATMSARLPIPPR